MDWSVLLIESILQNQNFYMTKWQWRLIFLSLLVPHIYLKSQKLILSIEISIENWNIFGINKLIRYKILFLIPFFVFLNQFLKYLESFKKRPIYLCTTTVHFLQPNIMWQTGNPISKTPMWKIKCGWFVEELVKRGN